MAQNRKYVFESLQARFAQNQANDAVRIVVVGSSQCAGHGATYVNEGMVEQLGEILKNASGVCKYRCINFGFNGSRGAWLLEDYQKLAPLMDPKLCIINLACNESPDEIRLDIADNLRNFVKFNREHNIATVFVKEAVFHGEGPILENHLSIQAVADEFSLPVVESHKILEGQSNAGLLWWDFVHPTSFGHYLIAKAIAETLEKEVVPKLCDNGLTTPVKIAQ